MTDRIRVAVVGTGRWAQVAHIPGWLRDPRAEVVALADVDESRAGGGGQPLLGAAHHRRLPASCSPTRTSTSWTW